MKTAYSATLESLSQQRGVVGCMVVAEADGIVVDAQLHFGVPGPALAAVAAALYRGARTAAAQGGLGETGFVRLEAEHGHLCLAGRGELLLVALTDQRANIGMMRSAMLKAVGGLR